MIIHKDGKELFIKNDHLFLGSCAGIALTKRGPTDPHIMFLILTEDDENWFISNNGFSSFWIDDLEIQIKKAKEWMENNAIKDPSGFGYTFK